jgi:hypothetical protein
MDAKPSNKTGWSIDRVNGAGPISSISYSETVGLDRSGLHLAYILRAVCFVSTLVTKTMRNNTFII